MSYTFDISAVAAQLERTLRVSAGNVAPDTIGLDGEATIQMLAGLLVETMFLFDDPESCLTSSLMGLRRTLGINAGMRLPMARECETAAFADFYSEKGREMARDLCENWLECEYEYHAFVLESIRHYLCGFEDDSTSRVFLYSYFEHAACGAMMNEIAAQELCDVVIEGFIKNNIWSLHDGVGGLGALAGRKAALANGGEDTLSGLLMQEAIRYGTPAGSDWRFGLAANDGPADPPYELLAMIEPRAAVLFRELKRGGGADQAVACAKAAGRMLAVVAGGNFPEAEPMILKPLTMAAFSESYRSFRQVSAAVC